MPEPKIFIHVGLHKTGTTFLQKEVFPKIKDIHYIFRVGIDTTIDRYKVNLLSDENLDGGSYRLFRRGYHRNAIALNLSKMFPSAKIIICIRDKEQWLKSAWKQYLVAYYGYSFEKYKELMDPVIPEFDIYIAYLKTLFKDVYVCHFEDLQKDPKAFVKGICDFMEVETPEFSNKKYYQGITDGQAQFIQLFDSVFHSKTMHFLLSLLIRFIRKDELFEKWGSNEV